MKSMVRGGVVVRILFCAMVVGSSVSAAGCGSLLREMLGGAADGATRRRCPAPDTRDREEDEDRERVDEAARIGVNRAALNVGRITASVRRTDATDFREIDGACAQGEVNEPALAVVELGDSTPRFDVSVRVDGRAPRRMALRNEDGATACVRVGAGRVGSWARNLSAGRYELLTDLEETGTYDIVVSSH